MEGAGRGGEYDLSTFYEILKWWTKHHLREYYITWILKLPQD